MKCVITGCLHEQAAPSNYCVFHETPADRERSREASSSNLQSLCDQIRNIARCADMPKGTRNRLHAIAHEIGLEADPAASPESRMRPQPASAGVVTADTKRCDGTNCKGHPHNCYGHPHSCGCSVPETTTEPKRWKLMPWRVAELREQADKLGGTLNVHEIQCLRDLLSSWLPAEAKAYGPGMTPHADDCVCAVCGPPPQQFCPHCGKSEPHTHRVPGVAEPVIFPHGSQVKTSCTDSAPAASPLVHEPPSLGSTAAGAVCTKHGVTLAFEGDECWACKEEA